MTQGVFIMGAVSGLLSGCCLVVGVDAMLVLAVMVPGISGCCQCTCCPALLPRPAPFTEDIATLCQLARVLLL